MRFISGLMLAAASAWCAGPSFDIRDFGARSDGSPATAAFRAAIQAAKSAGGGTVYVPAGKYTTGPIELVSNLTLYFDSGAVVEFPAQRLPFTQGREQGVECLTPVPLIGGRNLENVTIAGRGVLTTSNADWLKIMPRTRATANDPGTAFGPNWEKLLQFLDLRKPVPREVYEAAAPELRPSFIRTMDSKNVLIEGLRFAGSPMWTIHLLYTDKAVVRDVTIETYPGVHTDGIAVDSSRNVRISNCYIDTGDDGIVIKSGKDADGLRVNRPTENVSITNCTVRHAHGAVTIGSETAGWARNLTASNITCDGTQMGVRLKSRRGRGGGIENVRFADWTMQNVGTAIDVTNFYMMEGEEHNAAGPQPVSTTTPVFRNIAVSNMSVRNARLVIDVQGLPEMPISGLRISDLVASATAGAKAYNTDDLELHNVQIDAESGPAFLIRDSKSLELEGVSTRKPLPGTPVIRLDHCPGAIVRQSRAFPGTGTFLSVAPGELKQIALEGNVLSGARRATEESSKSYPMTPESPTEGEKPQ
jgi:polygalacturonase